jgi:hypothetical protein
MCESSDGPSDGTDGVPQGGEGNGAELPLRPAERELLAVFDRLAPQGSLRWAYEDGMARLDQEHSAPPWRGLPTDLWERGLRAQVGKRLVGDLVGALAGALADDARRVAEEGAGTRLRAAWDALRYLAARVEALESRVDPGGQVVPDLASVAPHPDLVPLLDTVDEWLPLPDRRGTVLDGECGEGSLCAVLARGGSSVHGVDPRPRSVWALLEARSEEDLSAAPTTVTCSEVVDVLEAGAPASLAGVVLRGCVDRADLPGKLRLAGTVARALVVDGAVAVVTMDRGAFEDRCPAAVRDLLPGAPIAPEAWALLLERTGFEVLGTRTTGVTHVITGRRRR